MTDGFVRMAAATPRIRVADPYYNAENIAALVRAADARRTKMLVLPELCLTGYTCGDLFLQNALLRAARGALARLAAETARCDTLFFVGLPLEQDNKLYNTAAAVQHGRVLGFVPKTHLPNYSEFYEARHFQPGNRAPVGVAFTAADGAAYEAPMGADLLFRCAALPSLTVGCEICEDLWAPDSPSIRHALAGATVLVNLSASDETTGKDLYRKALVTGQSARLVAAYV